MSLILDQQYMSILSGTLERCSQLDTYTYNFRCPYCGDSQKDKSKRRGYIFNDKKVNRLFFKCHKCQYSRNFGDFLKDMNTSLFKQYTVDKLKDSSKSQKLTKINNPKIEKLDKFDKEFFGLSKISTLSKDHLAYILITGRCIPEQYWDKLYYTDNFRLFVEKFTGEENNKLPEDKRIIIPFINENNELLCIQGRSMNKVSKTRYITIKKYASADKIYGLDTLDPSSTVRVVEGPIDSMFVNNCIATADSMLYKYINKFKDMVFIFDCQPRNFTLVKIIKKSVDLGCKVCIIPNLGYKDINDMVQYGNMSLEDIEDIIIKNTYQGLTAKLKLSNWK